METKFESGRHRKVTENGMARAGGWYIKGYPIVRHGGDDRL